MADLFVKSKEVVCIETPQTGSMFAGLVDGPQKGNFYTAIGIYFCKIAKENCYILAEFEAVYVPKAGRKLTPTFPCQYFRDMQDITDAISEALAASAPVKHLEPELV